MERDNSEGVEGHSGGGEGSERKGKERQNTAEKANSPKKPYLFTWACDTLSTLLLLT